MNAPTALPYNIVFTDGRRIVVNVENKHVAPPPDRVLMLEAIHLAEASGSRVKSVEQPGQIYSLCAREYVVGLIKRHGEHHLLTPADTK